MLVESGHLSTMQFLKNMWFNSSISSTNLQSEKRKNEMEIDMEIDMEIFCLFDSSHQKMANIIFNRYLFFRENH